MTGMETLGEGRALRIREKDGQRREKKTADGLPFCAGAAGSFARFSGFPAVSPFSL